MRKRNVPLEEIKKNLADTVRDSNALAKVIEGWQTFIFQPADEDRQELMPHLNKAMKLKAIADALIPMIEDCIASLKAKSN